MWIQVSAFIMVMFFIFLADAVLSDFVPGFMQNMLGGNAFTMGLVMSTSSVAGLILDFLFAKILRGVNVKWMAFLALTGAAGFAGLLLLAMKYPWVLLLIAAMVVWGFYYEMFGFSSQKFVVGIAPRGERTAVWSILETFMCAAYALGPLMSEWLAAWGDRTVLLTALGIITVGMVIFLMIKLSYRAETPVRLEEITLWYEFEHWRVLLKYVWPILIMGVVMAIVDAMFWTTGTVVNDNLAKQTPAGAFFVTAYMAPSLLIGFLLAKQVVTNGKKRRAQVLLLLTGLGYGLITLFQNVWWYLGSVFLASLLSAIAWPLMSAVYTDLLARMGRQQVHMVGLKNSTNSVGYIVGPILSGWLVGYVGEIKSFAVMGWGIVLIAVLLLILTPKKLRLPESEIANWE